MSGFEIAGAVLGAFPIIIEAANAYREAFQPLKAWWMFERTFEDFITDVGVQQSLFDNNLEKLLSPFIDSDAQMGYLIERPMGPAWQNTQLDDQLQDRLGKSYPHYEKVVQRMEHILGELQALLGVEDGKTTAISSEQSGYHWEPRITFKQLRLSFSKRKFRHIELLSKCNNDLSQLLQTNDELAPTRRQRQSRSGMTLIRDLHDHAQSLHKALKSAWTCSCTHDHCIKLCLERRHNQSLEAQKYWSIFSTHENETHHVQTWKELQVRVSEHSVEPAIPTSNLRLSPDPSQKQVHKQGSKTRPTLNTPNKPSIAPLLSSPVQSCSNMRTHGDGSTIVNSSTTGSLVESKKRVTFDFLRSVSRKIALSATTISSAPDTSLEHIENICSALKTMDKADTCIGFLQYNPDRRHFLHPQRQWHEVQTNDERITLQSVLEQSSSNGLKALTRRDRLTIAVILASSLLQLHNTPWLHDQWRKSDIYFHLDPSSNGIIPQPLLSQTFAPGTQPVPTTPTSSPLPSKFSPKAALSRLGIMLLELCFGKAIEDHPARPQFFGPNGPGPFTDFLTAQTWLEDVLPEYGLEMTDVIRRCLDCSFAPKPNFEDKMFQEAVFDTVLTPLQDCLKPWETNAVLVA